MKPTYADVAVFESEAAPASQAPLAPGEVVIGTLTGIDAQGRPLVDYPGNPARQPVAALSTLGVTHAEIGRSVALLFAQADARSPVIMGMIHSPLLDLIASYDADAVDADRDGATEPAAPTMQASVDGRRVVIEGTEEIVLKCGEASITLTRAGKILIRGKYVLSRADGVNRILGGAVQVN